MSKYEVMMVFSVKNDDEPEGFYAVVKFTAQPEFPAELDRVFKITDGVLRTMITNID